MEKHKFTRELAINSATIIGAILVYACLYLLLGNSIEWVYSKIEGSYWIVIRIRPFQQGISSGILVILLRYLVLGAWYLLRGILPKEKAKNEENGPF